MRKQPAGVGREILYEAIDGGIAVVTLNRPEVRNAINVALTEALDFLVKQIEADDAIRAAILTSSNDRVFCSGADLSEIAQGRVALLTTAEGGFAGFVNSPRMKPWIAAVRGYALGGGCELSLACDMIVASNNAQFGLPEVKRGLMAAGGGVYRLPRALPRHVALELVATGEPLDVARAAAFGLVNRVAPLDQVLDTAIALARLICANGPLAVRHSLRIARQAADFSEFELRVMQAKEADIVFRSEDAKEGPAAFMQKRPPQWKGR
jgi:enoyl-CoA hydratase/carnithine racemase